MIAFNAALLSPYSGGIATYMANLIEKFETLLPKDSLKIYLSEDWFDVYKRQFAFQAVITPLLSSNPIKRVLRENLYWNKQLKHDSIRLFHSPISYLPFNLKVKSILTVHDLRVYRFPETYPKLRRVFLKNAIRYSILKSDKIIAVSNFTKNEIIKLFGINPDKIEVIHEGVNIEQFHHPFQESDEKILRNYRIQRPYIFTVGHLEPRKNFVRLIQAYEQLQGKLNNKIQLVIGGKENFYFKSLYHYVQSKNLQNKVVFTGYIQDKDLPVLYRNAEIFAYPSIYEGFGFPLLESVAAGIPVVASNVSSIPEITGNSALYFDPYSIEDISDKLFELLTNRRLQEEIVADCADVLKRFTWEKCAKQTIKLYQSVMNS